jgi:hypothetical protein
VRTVLHEVVADIDDILDRLLHHGQIITIRGDSYRPREKRRSGLLPKAGPAHAPVSRGGRSPYHPILRCLLPETTLNQANGGCSTALNRLIGQALSPHFSPRIGASGS